MGDAGIDEQLIMERIDHQGVDGVQSYKHISQEQIVNLPDILIVPAEREHIAPQ